MTSQLKTNEEALLGEKKQLMDNLRLQEQRYDKMKSHAMQQLEMWVFYFVTQQHTTHRYNLLTQCQQKAGHIFKRTCGRGEETESFTQKGGGIAGLNDGAAAAEVARERRSAEDLRGAHLWQGTRW